MPWGAATTGTLAYLSRWQAAWNLWTICRRPSHCFCPAATTTAKRLAPTEKCSPWLYRTSPRKSRSALDRLREERDHVGVDAVGLGRQRRAGDAVAEVPDRAAWAR